MTNQLDQLKGLLRGLIAANPDTETDDRQAGRQDTAKYVLAAITLLESGVVTSLGFERFLPEDCPHADKGTLSARQDFCKDCGKVLPFKDQDPPKPSYPGAGTEVYEGFKVEDPPSYVVQVNGQYTYISDVQPRVQPGDTVDIESRSGGHWQGEVTDIFSVDDYAEDHDLPTLKILGLF